LVRHRLGNIVRDISYDAADRISGYTHYDAATAAANPTLNQSSAYDELGRLTGITTSTTSWTIGYDANGNRTSVTQGSSTRAYTTAATSNRLTGLTNPANAFTYDTAGNILTGPSAASTYTASYSLESRLATMGLGTITNSYAYDAMGQRTRKYASNAASTTVIFVYDTSGHLLGEYSNTGAAIREYIWLGDEPIAMFTPNGTNPPTVFYVHNDHLGTPRAILDTAGQLRWRWLAEPFGTTAPETNPQSLGAFAFNLRHPGQYADTETGLFYNWHRSYDAGLGRYTQSDPIGLAGGINTYAYALGNPVSFVDPDGLDATVCLYSASGPWGHVGIGINSSSTAGLYPRDGAGGNPVTGTPGIVKPDSGKAEQCKTFQTTAEQDKKMADFLARATANPGTYKFTGNNCTNLVRLTLQQGGISTPGQPGPRPYFESLPGRP
jgi:RHS repeat-associated protein